MANWSNPLLTSTYTNFVTEVKDRDVDLALQFDGTTSTNIATGTIRWNSGIGRWQKWNGSTWSELTSTYALTGLSTTGNATISGSIGIGAAPTSDLLELSATTDPKLRFIDVGNIEAKIGIMGSTALGFEVGGSEAARIDSNRQLVIAAKADGLTNGTIFNVPYTGGQANSVSHTLQVAGGAANALARIIMSTNNLSSNNSSFISFATSPGGGGAPSGDLTQERVRITSAGFVGIGTTSPSYALHVNTAAASDIEIAAQNSAGLARYGTRSSGNAFAGSFTAGKAFELWSGNSEAARIDSSGVFMFNSGYGSVATAYGCRAWANINAGATPTIRASGNVSSVTDYGTGVGAFTVSFTVAMPDANFAAVVSAGGGNVEGGDAVVGWAGDYATGYVRIGIKDSTSNANVDTEHCMVAIFR